MTINELCDAYEKIKDAYGMSDVFVSQMAAFEQQRITESDLVKYPAYQAAFKQQDEKRETMMEQWKKAMLLGMLLYLAFHPQKMVAAQTYYRTFRTVCPLKRK